MDNHVRMAATLHVTFGSMMLILVGVGVIFMSGLATLAGLPPQEGVIAAGYLTFSSVKYASFVLVGGTQVIAGIQCRRGSKAARIVLIVLSVLMLFNYPIGTLVGGYSLWALLRNIRNQPDADVARDD